MFFINRRMRYLIMPRKPRMYVAGLPSHVIQRGNNRGEE